MAKEIKVETREVTALVSEISINGEISEPATEKIITINVVHDSCECPECGAYWGHPDKALNYPNRFKVDNYCRCYNPKCHNGTTYYDPFTGAIEYDDDDGTFVQKQKEVK